MKQMQETKGKSRKQKKGLHSWYAFRRLAAFVLSFAMVFGNVGNSAAIAMAGEAGAEVMFRMEAEDVWEAAREAVESGAAAGVPGFGEEDSAEAAKYRNLFAEGKIFNITGGVNYTAEPDVDGVGLEVFVRIADDADLENYRLTGEEELLLMYVNSSDQNVTARVAAGKFVSSKAVVKSYREAFGKTDVPTEENAEDAEEMKAGSAVSGGGSGSGGTASEGADGAGTSAEGGAESSAEGGAQQGENGSHEEDGEAVGPSDDTAPGQAIDPVTENAGNEAEAGEKEEGSGELTQMPAEGAAGDKESGNAADNSSEQVTDDRGTDKAGDADKADQAEDTGKADQAKEENSGSVKPENSNNPTDEKDKENTADKEAGNAKDKDEGQDSEISVGNKSDQDGSKAEPDGNKSGQTQADRAEAGAEKDSQDKGKEKPEENKKEEAGSREESAPKNTDGNSGDSGDSGAKDSDNSEKGGSDGVEASEKSGNNDAKELSMSANRVNLVAKSIRDNDLGLVALNDGATAVVVAISLADTGFVAEDVSEEVQASAVIPAEVQAFLDAVKDIPAITPDNAEEAAEYIYGPVSEAYEVLLGTAHEEREDVQAAVAVMAEAMTAVDAALEVEVENYATNISVYDNTLAEVKAAFRNQGILQITGASVTKEPKSRKTLWVGDEGSQTFVPVRGLQCKACGNWLGGGKFSPTKYCEIKASDNNNITENIKFGKATTYDSMVGNTECLNMNFTGVKPGSSNFNVSYYCNFELYYDRSLGDNGGSYKRCYYCYVYYNRITNLGYIQNDATWHKYSETVPVTVNADYVLNYDTQGGSVVQSGKKTVSSTTANMSVTGTVPVKDGYAFQGWAETADAKTAKYQAGNTIVLDWEKDGTGNYPGSKSNPVSKNLYAVWKEDGTTPVDPTEPEAPKRDELYGLLGGFVEVTCVSEGEGLPHDQKTYSTLSRQVDGNYESEIGTPYQVDANWKVDVTLHGNVYAAMYSFEPIFGVGKEHQLAKNESPTKTITLTWDAGSKKWTSGSNRSTVLATFEVVCTAEPVTYTVTYTDGVLDKTIFPDQGYEGQKEGDSTPPFIGEIKREGFTFEGWKLKDTLLTPTGTVKPKVAKEDADANNEIIYIAVWKDNFSSQTPGINDITITKSAAPESVFIGEEVKFTIKVENGASQDAVVKVEDILPEGLTFEKTEENDRGSYDETSRTVTWDNISVPSNGSTNLYVWVKAEREGSFVNQAKVFLGEDSKEATANVEVKKPEDPKKPKLVVTKKNDGFKIDEKTGHAYVDYTVTITNKSGFSIYGLRLTDTLKPPTLTKVNESDIGEPNVQLTFKDFKKDVKSNGDVKDIVPEEGGENDRVHVMQLLSRNEVFEDEQTVTLTYTIEIENLNEDVEVEVKLDNTAKGESWSKAKDSGPARMLRSAASSSAGNDAPDISDSASSSASGSSSSTEGILPRKYSVTYRWDNLPEGAKEVLPDGAKYFPKNIVAVDDHYQKDTEIKVEDKIYTFSGWSTDDALIEEGSFTMPAKNVVIHGAWNEKKGETPDIPDKPDPNPDPTPSESKANYTVEWYDADSNEQIKESETRSGTADRTVSVRESDKEVTGYTFAEDNGHNVLSAVVAEDGSTVLKLYFTKNSTPPIVPDPEPERKDTVYTVIHEYYTNGAKSGENVQTITGKKVGDTVNAADIGRNTTYNGNTYSFISANPDSLVLEEDGDKNVITLRYDRTTSTSSNSRPSGGGGGGGGGSSATNLSGRVHGTNPEPSVTVPGDGVPLADIPEGADIPDEDVPLAGIPVADIPDADVPLSGFQGLTGIPDEDIPLASVPKTGDSSGLWHMMALLSAFSLMAVSMLDKKKRQEMKQEN